jgi:hypothetical protein
MSATRHSITFFVGSAQHAGFAEVEAWSARRPAVKVLVTGYGEIDGVRTSLELVRSGEPIELATTR